jgi:hypothetical protein
MSTLNAASIVGTFAPAAVLSFSLRRRLGIRDRRRRTGRPSSCASTVRGIASATNSPQPGAVDLVKGVRDVQDRD